MTYTVTFKVSASARRSAVAAASLQVKDPNYANNAAAIVVRLGSSVVHTAPRHASIKHAAPDPLAIGKRILARLEHRTLAKLEARPSHRKRPLS